MSCIVLGIDSAERMCCVHDVHSDAFCATFAVGGAQVTGGLSAALHHLTAGAAAPRRGLRRHMDQDGGSGGQN